MVRAQSPLSGLVRHTIVKSAVRENASEPCRAIFGRPSRDCSQPTETGRVGFVLTKSLQILKSGPKLQISDLRAFTNGKTLEQIVSLRRTRAQQCRPYAVAATGRAEITALVNSWVVALPPRSRVACLPSR